jgi:hypothetical protein
MRWAPGIGLAVLLLMIGSATPVRACINDRNVEISEREFKSSYQQGDEAGSSVSPQEYSPPEELDLFPIIAGSGLGSLLLVGAIGLCMIRRPDPA